METNEILQELERDLPDRVSEELRDRLVTDLDLAREAARRKGILLKGLSGILPPEWLFEDPIISWLYSLVFPLIPECIHDNRVVLLSRFEDDEMMDYQPRQLLDLSDDLRADKEFVLAMLPSITYCPSERILKNLPESLRDDKDVVLAVLFMSPYQDLEELQYASPARRRDRSIAMALAPSLGNPDYCLYEDCPGLEFFDPCLFADREVVLSFLNTGYVTPMRYVSSILCEDRSFVLEAVSIVGLALFSVANKFCHDREVVLHAVRSGGMVVYEKLPHAMKHDMLVVAEAYLTDGHPSVSSAYNDSGYFCNNIKDELLPEEVRESWLMQYIQCPRRLQFANGLHNVVDSSMWQQFKRSRPHSSKETECVQHMEQISEILAVVARTNAAQSAIIQSKCEEFVAEMYDPSVKGGLFERSLKRSFTEFCDEQ